MGQRDVVIESCTTRTVERYERADYWSELVSSFQCAMAFDFPRRDDFFGAALRQRSDRYQLVTWHSDPVVCHRTNRLVKRDSDGDYRLFLPVTGQLALRQHETVSALHAGEAGLVTSDRPLSFAQLTSGQAISMTIPRQEIDRRLSRSAPLVKQLNLRTGVGRVVSDLVVGLGEEANTLTMHQFNAVANRLVELLCMVILGDDGPVAAGHLAEVEASVRRYVREHVTNPRLNGEAVARALGWSLRQVQLALQQAGTTPRQLIREERLRLAHERLQDPAYRNSTITELASNLGFCSASAFSTAFRERFGVRPRDVRP